MKQPNPDFPLVIGELINHSYARARKAWKSRAISGYQELARLQTELGASYLTFNLDGTQTLAVTMDEMLAFLPQVVPAIQEVTDLPLSFDNPHVAFHREALRHYDRSRCRGRPILNSLSVTREDIDGMIDVASQYDLDVIVMASECFSDSGGHRPAESKEDIVNATRHFVHLLRDRVGYGNERVIVDPGLCPVASDTRGGVNLCLDSIRALRADPDLAGIHVSVGLSNFSIGAPKPLRIPLERAFLRMAMDSGLDFALANPEKNTLPLPSDDPLVTQLEDILTEGRPEDGEDREDAGFRQLGALMRLWKSQPANP